MARKVFLCYLSLVLSLLTACASYRSAARSDFDFSQIKSVSLEADARITAYVSRELLRLGIAPHSGPPHAADALLKVVLTRELPEKNYVVRPAKSAQETLVAGSEGQNKVTITYLQEQGHAPVELPGRWPYINASIGSSGEVLIASYAQALLAAELIDPKKGEVLWAGTYSYEGLDLESALQGAVYGLLLEIPLRR